MFYAGDGDEDDLVLLIAGDKKGLESEWFSGAFLRPALYSLEGSMVGFQGERDATSGNLFPTPNFNKFRKIPKTLDFKCILCITLEIEDCVNSSVCTNCVALSIYWLTENVHFLFLKGFWCQKGGRGRMRPLQLKPLPNTSDDQRHRKFRILCILLTNQIRYIYVSLMYCPLMA